MSELVQTLAMVHRAFTWPERLMILLFIVGGVCQLVGAVL